MLSPPRCKSDLDCHGRRPGLAANALMLKRACSHVCNRKTCVTLPLRLWATRCWCTYLRWCIGTIAFCVRTRIGRQDKYFQGTPLTLNRVGYAAFGFDGDKFVASCLACRLSFASNLFSLWASLVAHRVSSYSTWFLTMV